MIAVNNPLPIPAFGDRPGGGAEVTEEGRCLIATFRRLEDKLSRLSNRIADDGLEGREEALLWPLGVRILTRNVFRAAVSEVNRWTVDVGFARKFGEDKTLMAIVADSAADELELAAAGTSWRWSRRRFFGFTRPDAPRKRAAIASPAWWRSVRTPSATAKFGWTSAMARRYTPWRRVGSWKASALKWAQSPWRLSIRAR